jgi:hypothetical protein
VIEKCIEDWHRNLRGELPGGLDALLADDVVFYSPIVFTPQKGRKVTKLYLRAASGTFGGSAGKEAGGAGRRAVGPQFRYVREILCDPHAVLEFEAEVGGKYVNGVDMITCDGAGRIVEFKVMIRPLQAVNTMHQQMAAMLEKLKPA